MCRWTKERSSGTIPGEDIECQLQGLDRGELGRRNWQLICARAKADEDLKGEEEDGIGDLGTSVSVRCVIGLFRVWASFGEDVGAKRRYARPRASSEFLD